MQRLRGKEEWICLSYQPWDVNANERQGPIRGGIRIWRHGDCGGRARTNGRIYGVWRGGRVPKAREGLKQKGGERGSGTVARAQQRRFRTA